MEIKRKKISRDEIQAKENALAAEAAALQAEYDSLFDQYGYELTLDIGQKTDENEFSYGDFTEDAEKSYASGYISRALFTVRRKKTAEELAEDAATEEENRKIMEEIRALDNTEELEQLENDEALRVSEDTLKHTVAFTEVMLIRAYCSFWTDWISIGDGFADARADLDEFLAAVKEKAE